MFHVRVCSMRCLPLHLPLDAVVPFLVDFFLKCIFCGYYFIILFVFFLVLSMLYFLPLLFSFLSLSRRTTYHWIYVATLIQTRLETKLRDLLRVVGCVRYLEDLWAMQAGRNKRWLFQARKPNWWLWAVAWQSHYTYNNWKKNYRQACVLQHSATATTTRSA